MRLLGFGLLAAAVLALGCRTGKNEQPTVAQVLVTRMSAPALRELVVHQMRVHDWALIEKQPTMLVFERPVLKRFQLPSSEAARSSSMLRAEITFTEANQGVMVQGSSRRHDLTRPSSPPVAVSSTELQQILEEVRKVGSISGR